MRTLKLAPLAFAAALCVSALAAPPQGRASATRARRPAVKALPPPPFAGPRMFGITVDNVTDEYLGAVVDAVKDLRGRSAAKPMVRVVFDFDKETFDAKKFEYRKEDFADEVRQYKKAIGRLKQHADIMGELIDSSAVYRCLYDLTPNRCFKARAEAYAEGLRDDVAIWEIGNELNGEWVGFLKESWQDPHITVEQMAAARAQTSAGVWATYEGLKGVLPRAKTALTFYYNSDTVNHAWTDEPKVNKDGKLEQYGANYDVKEWVRQRRADLPDDVDYVFLSYYEDDNDGVTPRVGDMDVAGMVKILVALAGEFKQAQLGLGEFGPQCHYNACDGGRKCSECVDAQPEYISRYYLTLDGSVRAALAAQGSGWDPDRKYVGGYFYWYFNDDVVENRNSRTTRALKNAFAAYAAAR